jgi:hypothetical protein
MAERLRCESGIFKLLINQIGTTAIRATIHNELVSPTILPAPEPQLYDRRPTLSAEDAFANMGDVATDERNAKMAQ